MIEGYKEVQRGGKFVVNAQAFVNAATPRQKGLFVGVATKTVAVQRAIEENLLSKRTQT